jgi:phosphoribosylaminoimidazole (AIR) synthetase
MNIYSISARPWKSIAVKMIATNLIPLVASIKQPIKMQDYIMMTPPREVVMDL